MLKSEAEKVLTGAQEGGIVKERSGRLQLSSKSISLNMEKVHHYLNYLLGKGGAGHFIF